MPNRGFLYLPTGCFWSLKRQQYDCPPLTGHTLAGKTDRLANQPVYVYQPKNLGENLVTFLVPNRNLGEKVGQYYYSLPIETKYQVIVGNILANTI